jgi:hypothetical protein
MTADATIVRRSRQEQWLPILELAVQEVFAIMLGSRLELVSRSESPGPIELTAMVGLAGSLRGILTFGCGATSANQIAARMLSEEVDLPQDQVWDALGEICNMIAAIQTPQGTRYTRDGSFRVARTGELVTAAGNPVLGENGIIRVPAGPLSISSDGTLSVNGAVAGKIRQVEFAPDTQLASDGNALLSAPKGSEVPARETSIRQGMLETSNVDAIHSVITLVGVQRQAEMMQRALSLFHTEFNRIASNDLPRVS